MYYDHEFEGEQYSPCTYLVYKFDAEAQPDADGKKRSMQSCGAEWSSVVHPPDQFRHWCGICEAGGDHD